MCSLLPNQIIQPPLRQIIRASCTAHNSINSDSSDIINLRKLWTRERRGVKIEDNLGKDKKSFSLSRNKNYKLYTNGALAATLDPNVLLHRIGKNEKDYTFLHRCQDLGSWITEVPVMSFFEQTLPKGDNDPLENVLQGTKQVFWQILECVQSRNFDSLRKATLGSNTLDFHRNAAFKLTDGQLNSLKITEDDFIGWNGVVKNFNGFDFLSNDFTRYIHSPTFIRSYDAASNNLGPENYVSKYSVFFLALLKKNELYKLVNEDYDQKTRLPLKVPRSYGFPYPRYLLTEIEICHGITRENRRLSLSDEAMLYDFHFHSFSMTMEGDEVRKMWNKT